MATYRRVVRDEAADAPPVLGGDVGRFAWRKTVKLAAHAATVAEDNKERAASQNLTQSPPMARAKRRSTLAENWVSYCRSLIESPTLRVLSRAATLAMHRIELEHIQHGAAANGQLQVTRPQFEDWGVHRDAVARALREFQALGLVEVTEKGRAGVGGHGEATHFRLTYVNSKSREPPADEWRRIDRIEEAERIAKEVRAGGLSQHHRDLGRRGGHVTRERHFSVTEPVADSVTKTMAETPNREATETMATMRRSRKPRPPFRISGVGVSPDRDGPPALVKPIPHGAGIRIAWTALIVRELFGEEARVRRMIA